MLLAIAAMIIGWFASMARVPEMHFNRSVMVSLVLVMLALLGACGVALYRLTRFS
jgi:hypothetical protein